MEFSFQRRISCDSQDRALCNKQSKKSRTSLKRGKKGKYMGAGLKMARWPKLIWGFKVGHARKKPTISPTCKRGHDNKNMLRKMKNRGETHNNCVTRMTKASVPVTFARGWTHF